jgi:hypothetical protein
VVINTTVDSDSSGGKGEEKGEEDIGITARRLKEFRAKTKEQEDILASLPKSTSENPFPEHKEPTQDELKKYSTKPDPKSLRTNPKGGCDY